MENIDISVNYEQLKAIVSALNHYKEDIDRQYELIESNGDTSNQMKYLLRFRLVDEMRCVRDLYNRLAKQEADLEISNKKNSEGSTP